MNFKSNKNCIVNLRNTVLKTSKTTTQSNQPQLNMSSSVDFRILPVHTPSLCIPRVFSNIDEKRIRRIFADLNIGEIDRIDFVNKTTEKGEKYNRVFVHFKRWFSTTEANMAREKLLAGKEIKIIYDEPWFWKVSAYRETSQQEKKPRLPEKKKATMQFDDDFTRSSNAAPINNSSRHATDLSRYKPNPNRQEINQKRSDVSKEIPRSLPKSTAVPIPKLERGIATTYVPNSPTSTPPRQYGQNLNLGIDAETAALIDPAFPLPIPGPINEKQKMPAKGRPKKEKKPTENVKETPLLSSVFIKQEPVNTTSEEGEIEE